MPDQSQPAEEIRPRRSVLYMPGSNARVLEKARTLPADALILDLEDAVAPDAKEAAREQVCAAVREGFGKREVVVRINSLASTWGLADLAAVAAARPHAVLLPKTGAAEEICAVEAGLPPGIAVWAMIETAGAVLGIQEIASAGGRLCCLVLGSNDLIKEMGGRHMPGRANLSFAMSAVVLAAKAHGLQAIDGVHNDIADAKGFAQSCVEARSFGFNGKTLIHPSQIAPCNEAFAPSAAEVTAARKVVAAFALPENRDKGALKLDGHMVERLHAEAAARLIALHEAIHSA